MTFLVTPLASSGLHLFFTKICQQLFEGENLPHDSGWHRIGHTLVADIRHFPGEQIVNLNTAITLGGGYILIIVVKSDAKRGHVDRTQGAFGFHSELRTL